LAFIKVAESMEIPIYAEEGCFVSFFNSPYYPHINFSAIDIYSGDRKFGELGFSPVGGRITLIRPFRPPNPKTFRGSDRDWIIVVKCFSNPDLCVRILHLEPEVDVGEKVHVGDAIGRYLRTGHFDFWTDPHIHVEVRDPNNVIRAKGGYPLTPIYESSLENCDFESLNDEELMEASMIGGNYILARPKLGLCRIGNFWGLGCKIGESPGLLDGGIPHYGYGGVHLVSTEGLSEGDPVTIGDVKVGIIDKIFGRSVRFRSTPIKVSVGERSMKGLSLYLSLNPWKELKVVPNKPPKIEEIPLSHMNVKISDSPTH